MTDILFKVQTGTESGATILSQTNFPEHYPNTNGASRWLDLKPYVSQATDKYVIPVISAEFYDKIQTDFDNDLSGVVSDRIRSLCQDCVAFFSIYTALPHMNITISDMGVSQKASDTAQPLNQWRYKEARRSALQTGFTILDQLMEYLEKQKGDVYLNLWESSDEYKLARTDYFTKSSVACRYMNTKRGWNMYTALIPYLKDSQNDLYNILGGSFYDEFTALVTGGGALNVAQTELLHRIRLFLGAAAMVGALPSLGLTIEVGGVYSFSFTDGFDSHSPADARRVDQMQRDLERKGEKAKKDVLSYLYMNRDSFATFRDNTLSVDPSPDVMGSGPGGILLT